MDIKSNNSGDINSYADPGDNNLIVYDGNVGIGTTTPESELHLSNTDTSSMLILERTSGATGKWGLSLSGGDILFREITQNRSVMQLSDGATSNTIILGILGSTSANLQDSRMMAGTMTSAAGIDQDAPDFYLRGGGGTGAGTPGAIFLETYDATVSGSTAQSSSIKLTVLGSGNVGIRI